MVENVTMKQYICEECNKNYKDKTGLWYHNKKYHTNIIQENDKFDENIENCDEIVEVEKVKIKQYICKLCNIHYKDKSGLWYHNKKYHLNIIQENDKIIGIITDGDIRRMLSKTDSIAGITAKDIMTVHPKMIASDAMVADALNIMEDFSITQLIVADEGTYKGVIHLHDILKEGII